MDYLENLRQMLQVLLNSTKINLLIVNGPPGWGKTQTVTSVLNDSVTTFEVAGTFTTPLALFNQLAANPCKVHLLDDTAELFSNQQLLSILCSASWPTGAEGRRVVKRLSTSQLTSQSDFEFFGKIIVITNKIPKSEIVNALLSRSLQVAFTVPLEEIVKKLRESSQNETRFPNQCLSQQVADFLIQNIQNLNLKMINLRTLEIGYEIATSHITDWKSIFSQGLPWDLDCQPHGQATQLSGLVERYRDTASQINEYMKITGKSRRSYFYWKKSLNIEHP